MQASYKNFLVTGNPHHFLIAAASRKFQEKVLRKLYEHFEIPKDRWWPLINVTRERDGRPAALLSDFTDLFPAFPVMLGAASLADPQDCLAVDKLFRKFTSTLVYQQFVNIYDSENVTDGFAALMIDWPYSKNKPFDGAMVLHNIGADSTISGATWLWHDEGGDMLLQPLWRFLGQLDKRFGRSWIAQHTSQVPGLTV